MRNNVYFIILLLFASFNTSAQEFIKTIDDSAAEHFIRRIDNTTWLYNVRHYRSDIVQKLHTLTKMDATGTTFPSMTICNLGQMFDMEVADNRAYYIGTGSTVGSNVFGFVSLNQFPNGTPYGFPIEDAPYQLLAVSGSFGTEVFWAGYDTYTGKHCFTEFLQTPQPQSWIFYKHDLYDSNYQIDDMTATVTHIVFTVRDLSNHCGYIFRIQRSTSPVGPTARPTNVPMTMITTQAYSPLLIEAATNDTVYIVHSNSSSYKTLAVHKYSSDCSQHIASRQMVAPSLKNTTIAALSLAYDNYSKVLSILTTLHSQAATNSAVWHVGNSQMLSGGPVYGHMYWGQYIESFDHLQGTARNMVGVEFSYSDALSHVYRLKDNSWGSCSSNIYTGFSSLDDETNINYFIKYNETPIYYPQYTLPKTTGTTTVSTICPQQ